MDRALPGKFIDLMRDGVSDRKLRARGDRAIFGALLSTAASARQRGWSQTEWADLVMDDRNRLAAQARLKNGKPRGRLQTEKFLEQIWFKGGTWLSERHPAKSAEEMRTEANRRLALVLSYVSEAEAPLRTVERDVLLFAAERAATLGTLRVTIPRRQFMEALGIGLTALRSALAKLERAGLLVLVERGQPSGSNAKRRRANVYSLPESLPDLHTSTVPGTGMWCPEPLTGGAPGDFKPGALALISGAPPGETNQQHPAIAVARLSDGSITITLPPGTPSETLASLLKVPALAPDSGEADLPSNVRPLRRSTSS